METNTFLIRQDTSTSHQNFLNLRKEVQFWKNKYFELMAKVSSSHQNPDESIWIKDHGETKKILLTDIIMLEADSNYTIIYTTGGRKIFSSHTLKSWISMLGDDADFLRVHRSYLINKKHMVSYQKSKRVITMQGNFKVPVARRCQVTV